MFNLRFSILITLIFYSSFSFAADYDYQSQAQTAANDFTESKNSQYPGVRNYYCDLHNTAKLFECEFSMVDGGRIYNINDSFTFANFGDDPDVPPSCESPNFIDVVTNECVPPQIVCFTAIENMSEECVFIGLDDPDDDIPDGCQQTVDGNMVCSVDEPECYEVDGKKYCPESDNVCGVKNGTFECVDKEEEGCGQFNGEQVCFTKEGDKVEPDSPDHPDNGGNLDGDDSNDVNDPRDPLDGGNPDNQTDSGTNTEGKASEKGQKLANKSLSEINKGVGGISDELKKLPGKLSGELTEENTKTPADFGAELDAAGNSSLDGSGLDDVVSDLEDQAEGNGLSMGAGMLTAITGDALGLIPTGGCTDLGYSPHPGVNFSIGCEKTKKIRDFLSWVLYMFTVWTLFEIVTSPATRQK
jgi:hypothetical protein